MLLKASSDHSFSLMMDYLPFTAVFGRLFLFHDEARRPSSPDLSVTSEEQRKVGAHINSLLSSLSSVT